MQEFNSNSKKQRNISTLTTKWGKGKYGKKPFFGAYQLELMVYSSQEAQVDTLISIKSELSGFSKNQIRSLAN